MLFSGKENVFMCLVAFQKMFQKIFSNVWLCSWKYHRKHIFYLLLTFSHIFSVTKQIHNIIHSSKHKQNPEKNHQIRTNEGVIAIGEITIAIAIDTFARSRSKLHAMRRSWSRSTPIGTVPVIARCRCDRNLFFLSPSLSLSSIFQGRKSFEVKIETKMIFLRFGSEIWSTGNAFQFDRIWSNNQTPYFPENHFRNQFEVNSNTA